MSDRPVNPFTGQQAPVPEDLPEQPVADSAEGASILAPGRHRLHKAVIIKWVVQTGLPMAFALFLAFFGALQETILALSFSAGMGRGLLVALAAILLLAIVFGLAALFSYLSYKNFSWEIDDTEIAVYQGIISKKQTHIPFSRIHSIDTVATVLDRILGVVTMNIQTAGGTKPEATIAGLTQAQVATLRAEVFRRKSILLGQATPDLVARPSQAGTISPEGAVQDQVQDLNARAVDLSDSLHGIFGSGESFDAPVLFEQRLTTKELFLAALTGGGASAAVLSVVLFFSSLAGLVPVLGSFLGDMGMAAGDWFIHQDGLIMIGTLLLIALVFFLVVELIVVLSYLLTYGGFVVRRRAERIEVEHGLLQHRFNGISLSRIQALTIKRSLLGRIFGFVSVTISIVGNSMGNNSNEGSQASMSTLIHPFLKKGDVDAFIAQALPEFADRVGEDDLQMLPPKAHRRSLFRLGVWPPFWTYVVLVGLPTLLIIILTGGVEALSEEIGFGIIYRILLVIGFVWVLFGLLCGELQYRHARFGHDRNYLVLRSGAFRIDEVVIPRSKIQTMWWTANPLQRRKAVDLRSLKVSTPASDKNKQCGMKDLASGDVEEMMHWMERRSR